MPDAYLNTWWRVHCNDCLLESDVRFNIIGLKCSGCGSYNTGKIGDGTEEHEVVGGGAVGAVEADAATFLGGDDLNAIIAAQIAHVAAHFQGLGGGAAPPPNEDDDDEGDDDDDDDDGEDDDDGTGGEALE